MEKFDLMHHGHLPILFKNPPHSKVLEPVCLFYSYLPPIMIHPPREMGWEVVKLPERPEFFQRLDPGFEWLDPSFPSQRLTEVVGYNGSEDGQFLIEQV
jgi:hypothetical protein